MAFMFENLQVYQKAADFADKIASQPENFPRGNYCLVDQLNHAALSIATNLAEGNGRFTKPDRKTLLHNRSRIGPGMRSADRSRWAARVHL